MPEDELSVSSIELRHAAHQVDTAGSDVLSAAGKAYSTIQADSARWVGDSKSALEKTVEQLRRHSDRLGKRLTTESHRIDYAAQRYAETERRNAERIRKAGGSDSSAKLNMHH